MQGYTYFFLFLLQNIDCGYSLKPPRRGGSNVYPQSMFWSKNKKNIKNFLLEIFTFYNLRKICILHGHVFVMFLIPCLCSTYYIAKSSNRPLSDNSVSMKNSLFQKHARMQMLSCWERTSNNRFYVISLILLKFCQFLLFLVFVYV